jgi:hypothetical protein
MELLVKIVLKGDQAKIPDFGLGHGVICQAVVTVRDDDQQAAGAQLSDAIRALMEKTVGYTVEVIEKPQA